MKNEVRIEGGKAWIQLQKGMEAAVDEVSLGVLKKYDVRWRAHPARAPKGKFYAMASFIDRGRLDRGYIGSRCIILMHRVILGLTDPEIEGHHIDNDGLNNRRENLKILDHRSNMRERDPGRDWAAWDREQAAEKERIAKFKRLVGIGKEVAEKFDLTRQQMWKIRVGICGSKAADEYWDRVKEEFAELFEAGDKRHPWFVVRPFMKRKPWKRVAAA